MPLGIRCSAVLTPLMTSVWPALWPPWKRTTPCALSVSQSTSLPLPSSPHWVPTTTTFLPVVMLMVFLIQRGCTVHWPLRCDEFAVAMELVDLAVVAGQDADHRFAARAQLGNGAAEVRCIAPRCANRRSQRLRGQHAHQLAQVEAEADRRPIAPEHGADFVVAAAADQRVARAVGVHARSARRCNRRSRAGRPDRSSPWRPRAAPAELLQVVSAARMPGECRQDPPASSSTESVAVELGQREQAFAPGRWKSAAVSARRLLRSLAASAACTRDTSEASGPIPSRRDCTMRASARSTITAP